MNSPYPETTRRCERWRHRANPLAWLLTAIFVTSVAACSTPTYEPQEVEPTFELPEDWHHEVEEGEEFDHNWCTDFGDPRLGEILEIVYTHNLDIRIARSRIDEARALLAQNRSRRYPSIDLQAEAEVERSPDGWEPSFEISAPAAYEVDLWGRISSELSADEIDLEALGAELFALKMVLATETAEQYYELARIRTELRLLDDQLEVAETFLELTKVRHAQGIASAIDVVQQEQQIEELHESRRSAELAEELTLHALATLMGQPPGFTQAPFARRLPEKPPPVADFIPADLLERRPDVAASRMRVTAANHRLDAALKEQLPRLIIGSELALRATSPGELLDFLFASVVGTIIQPLWDGGRVQGRVDEEAAVMQRHLLEFSSVLLTAIREVEDTLARGQAIYEILEIQRRQLEAAEEALELAQDHYRAGMLDYLRVLTALQSIQQLQSAELDSRRALLSQRIQLCRVAGGDWPARGDDSDDDQQEKEDR